MALAIEPETSMVVSTSVSECSPENRAGLRDAVLLRVDSGVPVGVAFQVEPWQEALGLAGVEETAVGVHCHHLTGRQVFG